MSQRRVMLINCPISKWRLDSSLTWLCSPFFNDRVFDTLSLEWTCFHRGFGHKIKELLTNCSKEAEQLPLTLMPPRSGIHCLAFHYRHFKPDLCRWITEIHTNQSDRSLFSLKCHQAENANIHTKYNRDTDIICWTSLSFYKLLYENSNHLIKKHLSYICKILWL